MQLYDMMDYWAKIMTGILDLRGIKYNVKFNIRVIDRSNTRGILLQFFIIMIFLLVLMPKLIIQKRVTLVY